MNNKFQRLGGHRAAGLASAAMLLALSAPAFAQDADREETAEFGVQFANWSGGDVTGLYGAALDFSNDTAIGITGGYNLNDRMYFGGEWTWADPTYSITRVEEPGGLRRGFNAEADISSFLLKFQFNFLETAITPFVELGGGWIRIDSNVVSDVDTGCWWDPWWGYVCANWYDTYSDTRTGYTYAAGVRWDLDALVMRASYGIIEMDTNYAIDNIDIEALRFQFDWKF
jgi:opacity protein-like surface antigen